MPTVFLRESSALLVVLKKICVIPRIAIFSFYSVCSRPAESDVRSLLGSIQFVLTSASRFSTGEDHLRAELQQVGLPREHAASLAKVYHDNADSIRKNLIHDSLMSEYMNDAHCYIASLPSINKQIIVA